MIQGVTAIFSRYPDMTLTKAILLLCLKHLLVRNWNMKLIITVTANTVLMMVLILKTVIGEQVLMCYHAPVLMPLASVCQHGVKKSKEKGLFRLMNVMKPKRRLVISDHCLLTSLVGVELWCLLPSHLVCICLFRCSCAAERVWRSGWETSLLEVLILFYKCLIRLFKL